MTCEDLLDWAERKMGGDFKTYNKVGEFQTELVNLPDTATTVRDARTSNAKDKLQDWLDGKISVSGYDAEDVIGDIRDNETKDVMDEINKARTQGDLDRIDTSGFTADTGTHVEEMIEAKRGELLTGSEEVEKELMDIIGKATVPGFSDELPYSMGELQREFGKEIKDKISLAVAEKEEQLFDIEQAKKGG